MAARKTETERALTVIRQLIKAHPGELNLTLLQERLRGRFSQACVARALIEGVTAGDLRREGVRRGTVYFIA